jgi:hypothetical protein
MNRQRAPNLPSRSRPELQPYILNRSTPMSDASQREWRFYLNDIVDFAGKALKKKAQS